MYKKIIWLAFMLPAVAFSQALLPTSWGFSSPGVSTPPTGWVYGVGTNGNLTYGFGKNDALSGRLDATGEFISINFADKPGSLSFYLSPQNAGNAWGGQFDVQESVDGQNWTTIHSVTTKATTATNFNDPIITKTLNQNSRWVRFYFTTKLPGGNPNVPGGNMAVDLVTITAAPPPVLQLVVKQNTTTLVNGNTFVYGNGNQKLFTIQNNGTDSNLVIDSIVLSGTNASDFVIGGFDNITPPNGGTDTFSVYMLPLAVGSTLANVIIYTNDADRSPFVIKLYGIGGQYATEPVNQASYINITDVTTHAFNVKYGGSADAEKYLVLRKPINFIGETPQDGLTYKKGDYIGAAQVAYVGPDTNMLKPTYILANTHYTFAVFAFNGPDGYQNYQINNPPNAFVTTPGGEPGNYYNNINPSLPSFIADLHNKIKVIDTIFYSSYASVMVNNYLTRDTSNGKKLVNCVYTNDAYVYEDPFAWWTGQGGNPATLTREHTFAQSWMPSNSGGSWPLENGKEVSEYNDMHNLFPANQTIANAKRSNNPFGIVVNASYVSPTGSGKLGTDANGKTVYEPKDDQKGDLARALFYMLVRFNGVNNTQWRLPSNQDINVLLQWHNQDPPSNLEIARNQYISTTQKNRNPFIDNPTWVDRINFQTMTYIPDGNTPVINLTAPVINSTWVNGKTYSLTWTSQNIDTILIQYQKNSVSPFVDYAVVAAANGSYPVMVDFENSTTAKFKLVYKNNPSIQSTSGAFKVVTSQVEITAPAAGTNLIRGTYANITWTSQYIDTLVLQYQHEPNTPYIDLTDVPANANSYSYFISFFPTPEARFRLMDKTDTSRYATSGSLSVVQPEVDITEPNNGTEIYTDSTFTLTLNKSFVDTVVVTYNYMENGNFITLTLIDKLLNNTAIISAPANPIAGGYLVTRELSNKPLAYIVSDSVAINFKQYVGLKNNVLLANLITVYPIPSNGKVYISNSNQVNIESFWVTDITGKQVLSGNQNSFNISHNGIYFLYVKTNKGIAVKKLVIE